MPPCQTDFFLAGPLTPLYITHSKVSTAPKISTGDIAYPKTTYVRIKIGFYITKGMGETMKINFFFFWSWTHSGKKWKTKNPDKCRQRKKNEKIRHHHHNLPWYFTAYLTYGVKVLLEQLLHCFWAMHDVLDEPFYINVGSLLTLILSILKPTRKNVAHSSMINASRTTESSEVKRYHLPRRRLCPTTKGRTGWGGRWGRRRGGDSFQWLGVRFVSNACNQILTLILRKKQRSRFCHFANMKPLHRWHTKPSWQRLITCP